MDTPTFQKLTYGNIIKHHNRRFMVQHTLKDAQGNTTDIGVIEAFNVSDAAGLNILNTSSSRTFLQGAPDGKLVLMGETVQAITPAKK